MFLRWKTRHKGKWQQHVTHSASLVQNVRIEGAVRQQYIAYIGSIVCIQGQFSSWSVNRFWTKAEKRFDKLALSEEQRVPLRATITHRIGPPLSEEALQEKRRKEQAEFKKILSLSFLPRDNGQEGDNKG
jgi:hypothetical protein